MNTIVIAVIVIVIVAVAIIIGAVTMGRRKRGERLKQQFGPEYEHQLHESGSRSAAEAALLAREKRVEKLDIRPLPPEQRKAFADDWQQVQARFVDDPARSIALADALVAEVMKARGYPVDDFDQRAADISVEHPQVVQNYRAAHEIALRQSRGQADTEDLRSALLGYRSLFEELLHADQPEPAH
jgi:type II secretory pathway pseudopilin PulG